MSKTLSDTITGLFNQNWHYKQLAQPQSAEALAPRPSLSKASEEGLSAFVQSLETEIKDMQGGQPCAYHDLILDAVKACVVVINRDGYVDEYKNYLLWLVKALKPENGFNLAADVSKMPVPQNPDAAGQAAIAKISDIHKDLVEKYNSYLTETSDALKNILGFYADKNLHNKISWWQKFYRGYYYRGEYATSGNPIADKRNKALISLIDSLEQRTPGFAGNLLAAMNGNDFRIEALADEILLHFDKIQTSYLAQIKAYEQAIINGLFKSYQNEITLDNLKVLYAAIIDPPAESADQQKLPQVQAALPAGPLKLIYDIKRIKKQVKVYRDYVEKYQLARLKDEVNEALTTLGMAHKCLLEIKTADDKKPQVIATYAANEEYYDEYFQRKAQIERKKKAQNSMLSVFWMIILGAGEGFVAALGAFPLVSLSPLGITILTAVWLAGLISNYALTVRDTEDTFNQLRLGTLYVDEDDKPISNKRKNLVRACFVFSVLTGVGYGALSFMSVNNVFLQPLFALMGAGAGKTTLMVFGYLFFVIPPIFTAIGFACIFHVTISDFIKNYEKRMAAIKEYLYDAFYAPIDEMSWLEIAGLVPRYILEIIKLSIGLVVVALITWATFGLMYGSSLDILKYLVSSKWQMTAYAWVIGSVTTGVNSFFSADKVVKIFQPLSVQGIIKFLYIFSGIGLVMSLGITAYNTFSGQQVSVLDKISTNVRGETFSGIDNAMSKPINEQDVTSFLLKTVYALSIILPLSRYVYNKFSAQPATQLDVLKVTLKALYSLSIVLPLAVYLYSTVTQRPVSVFKKIDESIGQEQPLTLAQETQEYNSSYKTMLMIPSTVNSTFYGMVVGNVVNRPSAMTGASTVSAILGSICPIAVAISKMTEGNNVTEAESSKGLTC